MSATPRRVASRFASASTIGSAGGLLVFLALLLNGHWSLLQRRQFSDFPDAQAHALLAGHWNVPAHVVGIEGITVNGKSYEYFGPVPALLRLPVAVFTHRFDGRLTQISMLLALGVALWAVAVLVWQVRGMRQGPEASLGRAEWWAVAAFMFVAGGGSVLLFLGSRADVYHEAELWGATLALGAFALVLRYLAAPTGGRLALAGVAATLALLARASVGSGPVIALGVLFLCSLLPTTRRLVALPEALALKRTAGLACACALPVLLYMAINAAKFGSPVSIPFDKQVVSHIYVARQSALAANGGSLFGLRYIPTTLFQYFRPDAIRPSSLLPWLQFPGRPAIVGGATFDQVDLTSSIPASMPALFALACAGLVALLVPLRDSVFVRLRAVALGAALATASTLAVAEIAQRYVSDFVPLLVVLAVAGFETLVWWCRSAGAGCRGRNALLWSGLGLLAAWSVAASGALGIVYQNTTGPDLTTQRLSDFVATQYSVHDAVPGGAPPHVRRGPSEIRHLPAAGQRGDVFVVGRCDAVYWYSGTELAWRPLYRAPEQGERSFAVRFPSGRAGERHVLLSDGLPGHRQVVAVQYVTPTRVRFQFLVEGRFKGWSSGTVRTIDPRRTYRVTIAIDPRVGQAGVSLDGDTAYSLSGLLQLAGRPTVQYLEPVTAPTLGRAARPLPATLPFRGTIVPIRVDRPTLCKELER
jgi:hypothetical protein